VNKWPIKGHGVRRIPGTMNRIEADYEALLRQRLMAGEIVAYWYEGMTLKLGQDCRYTPDFMVMAADGTIELHETKGFMEAHSLVKVKTCADKFPFRLCIVTRAKKKDGGAWCYRWIDE
jgi:hypothetical protein